MRVFRRCSRRTALHRHRNADLGGSCRAATGRGGVTSDHVAHCIEHAISSGNKADQRKKIAELMAVIGRPKCGERGTPAVSAMSPVRKKLTKGGTYGGSRCSMEQHQGGDDSRGRSVGANRGSGWHLVRATHETCTLRAQCLGFGRCLTNMRRFVRIELFCGFRLGGCMFKARCF